MKTLHYSIPPVFFLHVPVSNCLLFGNGGCYIWSLSNARNTKQKFTTTRALNASNTYYFSTHCWVVRRRGAMRDLRAVRLCVRTQRSLLSPCLAHTLLAHRPAPAACTQPGGTTNVHYTRRIRLDVFHVQEYVLIMIWYIHMNTHTYCTQNSSQNFLPEKRGNFLLIFAKNCWESIFKKIVYCRNHRVTITNTQLKVYFVYLLFKYWSSRILNLKLFNYVIFQNVRSCTN